VDKVTFTGETGTGQKILDAAKGNMKRLSLELGGKSPSLVFADADLDAAVEGTFGAVYFNQGQCCIAGARVYVQDTVREEFLARLADRVRAVRLGDGLDPQTTMGPLVSAEQRDRVLSLVRSGLDDGATAIVGGTTVTDPALEGGFYVTPTILTGVTPDMRVCARRSSGRWPWCPRSPPRRKR
jgi:phenylacetaldehyde dehydrogenase